MAKKRKAPEPITVSEPDLIAVVQEIRDARTRGVVIVGGTLIIDQSEWANDRREELLKAKAANVASAMIESARVMAATQYPDDNTDE